MFFPVAMGPEISGTVAIIKTTIIEKIKRLSFLCVEKFFSKKIKIKNKGKKLIVGRNKKNKSCFKE